MFSMKSIILSNGYWVLWIYILVFLPFQVFDFYKQEIKTISGYIYNFITLLIGALSLYLLVAKQTDILLVPNSLNLFLVLILIVVYIQAIYQVIIRHKIRDILFLSTLSMAILMLLLFIKF